MYYPLIYYLINYCVGIQDLLTNPNPKSPANGTANDLFLKKPAEYKKRIKAQAAKFISDV